MLKVGHTLPPGGLLGYFFGVTYLLFGQPPPLGVVVHRDQHHPLPRGETALKNSDSALGTAHSAGAVR